LHVTNFIPTLLVESERALLFWILSGSSSSFTWSSQSGCTIVSCPSTPTQTGYSLNTGSSTYGSTRTASCVTGFTGTASSITCQASAAWTSSTGCTIRNCGNPTAGTGYALGSGSTTYGSTYTMTCVTGYTGTAASLTCESSGSWSSQSGCTLVSCPSAPTQTGYSLNTGSSTYGSTRTASCATGYTGSASSITCQASAEWSSSTGCTLVDCGPIPEVVGYVFFNTTADTHWPVAIDTACATGHEGSNVTNLTCQLDATWTEVQGCTLVDCGVAEVGEGYELSGQGDTTYGASQVNCCWPRLFCFKYQMLDVLSYRHSPVPLATKGNRTPSLARWAQFFFLFVCFVFSFLT
jgi:hypothetical protein